MTNHQIAAQIMPIVPIATILPVFIASNDMRISRPIHLDNRLSRHWSMCMLVRPIIELSPRDPHCNAKMKAA